MGCFSGSSSKQVSESKTPRQKQELDKAFDVYGPTLGQPPEIYPESRVAPFSDLQQKSLTGADRFVDYFSTPEKVGTPLFEETGQATKGLLTGETGGKPFEREQVEDYFKGAIYEPTMKTFREDVIPGIEESHAGPGFFGSARSHELSEAHKDVADWLGTQRTGLEWDVLQSNQALAEGKASRSLATLGPAMAYGQVPAQEIQNNLKIAAQKIGGLNQLFGFGQAEQTQEQAQLLDYIMRYAEENHITDPENLQILLELLGMNFSSGSRTSTGPGLGYSMLASAGGAAGGEFGAELGGAAWSALIASDARVKENIKPFDGALEKIRKLKPFVYNYIGQKENRIGLIAQDVEKVLPEAVVEIDGVKHVDLYAMQALIVGAMNELLGDK